MAIDNSFFEEKVLIRIKAIEGIKKPVVLECYTGEGKLWDEVKNRTIKNIMILRIEKERQKGQKIYLQGDNLKYLSAMDLNKFDVIDLDAYGIPYRQLEVIFFKKYKGIVIVTCIQSIFGKLPNDMLKKLGFTKKMISKIPTLFYRNGIEKLKNYLYLYGVQLIEGYFIERKNYFYFKI